MSFSLPDSSIDGPPRPESGAAPDELEQLRELLLAREQRQLSGLQQRLEDPVLQAQEVSRVLPRAVALATTRDQQLSTALTPVVENALKASVRRDPTVVVNAIFPVMGPAIRRAIAESLSRLIQSLDQALDHSLSWRGLTWRLEAARSGKRFAEVVLAHTLVFRVEQVFLIHRHTGLLLLRAQAADIQAPNPDMVSAMLTAIQDFVQDSFRATPGESLQGMQLGELNVWIESSPLLTLAAVIRGQAPSEFRGHLQQVIEQIHGEHRASLESFDGENAPLELARHQIESCLVAEFQPRRRRSHRGFWLFSLLLLALLIGIGWRKLRANERWAAYLDRIQEEEGIVVFDSGKRSGKYFVRGWRDPLAADPATLISAFSLDPQNVVGEWETYQALSPALVLKRAQVVLEPPAGVSLRLRENILIAEGTAPAGWLDAAQLRAAALPGIQELDGSGLRGGTAASSPSRRRQIEEMILYFGKGTGLMGGQEPALAELAEEITGLHREAVGLGHQIRISVRGHADATGSANHNLRLSQQRAEHIAGLLAERGVPASILDPVGLGEDKSGVSGLEDQPRVEDRRVTFQVVQESHTVDPEGP